MEFTKTEQRILSPRHEKWGKVMLWIGILCLCLSVALIPYTIHYINKAEKHFDETQFNLSPEIETTTKEEIKLKELLIKSLAINKELWLRIKEVSLNYIAEKSFRLIVLLFIMGWFLVASYFRSRIYMRLIRKLQKS